MQGCGSVSFISYGAIDESDHEDQDGRDDGGLGGVWGSLGPFGIPRRDDGEPMVVCGELVEARLEIDL